MPTSLPEPKKDPWDKAWLFSRVMLFLLVAGASLLAGVCLSVWVGYAVFASTGSKVFALAAGVSMYFAVLAGRSNLLNSIGPRLFSEEDERTMDKDINAD